MKTLATVISATTLAALASPAFAGGQDGPLVSAEIIADETYGVNALFLEDEIWSQGDDWDHDAISVILNEHWIGESGSSVGLEIDLNVNELAEGGTVIEFDKTVYNDTNHFWSGFKIELHPEGATTMIVDALSNAAFDDVSVSDDGGGNWTIMWGQGAGTGVAGGESTTLEFSLIVFGDIHFSMWQTAIPAPGALALLAVAGLAGRRRRNA